MPIHGYHGSGAAFKAVNNLIGSYVGIEFETFNPNGNVRTAAGVDNVAPYKQQRAVCERDGSIAPDLGVEVITPPIGYRSWAREDGYLGRLITALRNAGCRENPADNYGMHINVNVNGWEQYLIHRVSVCTYMLRGIAQKLGGRQGENGRGNDKWYWIPLVEFRADGTYTRRATDGKYCPANIRTHAPVIEFRYPKALLIFSTVKANISFIYSMREFATQSDIGNKCLAYFAHMSSYVRLRPIVDPETAAYVDSIFDLSNYFSSVYLTWLSKQRKFRNLYQHIAGLHLENIALIADNEFNEQEIFNNANQICERFGAAVQNAAKRRGAGAPR